MRSFTDEGIVLRRIDYADCDRILTVLTREHGKVGVIARGVRKANSRLAAFTDLFSVSRMHLARGRGELLVLTQAEVIAQVDGRKPQRAACAAVIVELTDRVLESHHPDPEIFDLVAAALVASGNPARDPRTGLVWFVQRMIDRLGYAPQLRACATCGEDLNAVETGFSAGGGGLLCPRCLRADLGAITCSVRVIKVLRVAAAADAETWARLRLDAATLTTLEVIAERELEQHLDRRLRSWAVLRALEAPRV
ncbi:MAG: DNA repair protein RecO [Candidatus Dormibacteria bacterium]